MKNQLDLIRQILVRIGCESFSFDNIHKAHYQRKKCIELLFLEF